MTLSSIQDPPDASTIVGYILVIPTPGGKSAGRQFDCAINRVTVHGTWVQEIQEFRIHGYKISGNSVIVMPRSHEGARCTVSR